MAEVLIIKPSSLGDIVHGLLVAQSIKQQMPGARISWVARDVFAPLTRTCPVVDQTFVFERHGGVRAFTRLIGELRECPFDYVLDMQGLARTGLLTFFAQAQKRIGRQDARELAGLAYHERVGTGVKGDRHAVEVLLDFLPALGLRREVAVTLPFRIAEADGLDKTVAEAYEKPSAVLLFPESRRAEKEWPHFAPLAEALLDQGRTVYWAGSGRIEPPKALAAREGFHNLNGKTRLEDLPSLIRHSACVVANDSGPMHLAAAVGTPLVALFGPTSTDRFGPWPPEHPRHRIVKAPNGHLSELTPATVAEAVEEMCQAITKA